MLKKIAKSHNWVRTLYSYVPLCVFIFFVSCSKGERALPLELPEAAIGKAIREASLDPMIEYGESIPKEWWTLFDDEQLSHFILKAFYANPTVQSARANILLAAYNADRLKSTLFPLFTLGGDILREKFSETGLIPFNSTTMASAAKSPPLPVTAGTNGIPVYFTQYETEINLTYDFDVWGQSRNTWVAGLGRMWANAADEIFTRLQVAISIAKIYYHLQIHYKREEIAQALVDNQIDYLNTQQQRLHGKIENNISIQNSQTSLTTARLNLLQIQNDIAVEEYQLKAYLAGNFLEEIEHIEIDNRPLPKIPIPDDLPLHLLSRRPDITAQLWLIASAGKQIKAAKAGFYPDFSLTGLYGYQTIHLHKLFEWPSTFFNLDPAFSLPIFDGGRLLANLRGSEINYDLAILQYNQMILNAVEEVLSSLATLRTAEKQLEEYESKLNDQEEVLKLTKLKQKHNLSSQLDVLLSEQNVLNAQNDELIALGNTLQAVLSLIKALGGGYQVSCEEG